MSALLLTKSVTVNWKTYVHTFILKDRGQEGVFRTYIAMKDVNIGTIWVVLILLKEFNKFPKVILSTWVLDYSVLHKVHIVLLIN